MPTLDVSELNIVISLLGEWKCPIELSMEITFIGAFTILYGFISVKIKQDWYLGEALPAVIIGIVLGPVAAKFLDSERWGHSIKDQTEYITLVGHPTCALVFSAYFSRV